MSLMVRPVKEATNALLQTANAAAESLVWASDEAMVSIVGKVLEGTQTAPIMFFVKRSYDTKRHP